MNFRENGGDSFKTTCGAILSLILIITVILYSLNKTTILITRDDTMVSEFTQKSALSENVFSFAELNAFSAFGLFSGDTPVDEI